MAKKSGHSFPSDFGFTGSAGRVSVRSHTRAPRYAQGGKVKFTPAVREHTRRSMTHKGAYESGPPHSHMRRGGEPEAGESAVHERSESRAVEKREHRMSEKAAHRKGYAMGGPVKASKGGYAKGGDIAQDKQLVSSAIKKHIRAPKPRGHGVK